MKIFQYSSDQESQDYQENDDEVEQLNRMISQSEYNDSNQNDKQPENNQLNISYDQDPPIQNESQQKSTQKIKKYKRTKTIIQKISRNEPIVEQCESKKQKKQSQTKNLPKLFLNLIFKKVQSQNSNNSAKYLKVKQAIAKYKKKSTSLKTLANVLIDPEINKTALDYIQSYEFLDHILTSERLQDVSSPIYYTNKIYQACFNSHALDDWKQS